MTSTIITHASSVLNINNNQIQAVLDLNKDGCTIPFIARYRKEATGNLDEVAIKNILDTVKIIEEREKRREYIITYLKGEGKLTPELKGKLIKAKSIQELEDLYLPYKPRKKTKADEALEKGLEPLAELIISKELSSKDALVFAEKYINENVNSADEALDGAMDILVQRVSDSPEVRSYIRQELQRGAAVAKVKRGKKDESSVYKDYFDFNGPVNSLPAHRVMALLRAEKEKILSLSIDFKDTQEIYEKKAAKTVFKTESKLAVEASSLSLERHLKKSLSTEIFKGLKEKAEEESLVFFSRNLEKILLYPPYGEKCVIGIDPGIRTGCKAVLIDDNGNFKENMTLYLHKNPSDAEKISQWINAHNVEAIAVGDGTYGKETCSILKNLYGDLVVIEVDEDGASVYSASDTAREEFPDLDATVRGAISIARRFQDPLGELVKVDPASLGVGQYQHDIHKEKLREKLKETVQWVVNRVGVNCNTASSHLLSYISGLDKKSALEIVKYRKENRKIQSRKELKGIKGIGPKTFEQCAGFIRIFGGENILDSTGVHPESYKDLKDIAAIMNEDLENLINMPDKIDLQEVKKNLNISELVSVIEELKKGGLDPRDDFTVPQFDNTLESFEDVKEGMIVPGKIDNVVAFGAFVDIGLKEKGLVHISEISHDYVSDIFEFLNIGDMVTVKILSLDNNRKRISLTMKL
jgi:uncharacterized protein